MLLTLSKRSSSIIKLPQSSLQLSRRVYSTTKKDAGGYSQSRRNYGSINKGKKINKIQHKPKHVSKFRVPDLPYTRYAWIGYGLTFCVGYWWCRTIYVEEELEVITFKQNEQLFVDPNCSIILDSGAESTTLPIRSVKSRNGEKFKVRRADEKMINVNNAKINYEYKANIGINKNVLFTKSSNSSQGLISLGALLDEFNETAILFSLNSAYAIKLKDLKKKLKELEKVGSLPLQLIAERHPLISFIKKYDNKFNYDKDHSHDMWYCYPKILFPEYDSRLKWQYNDPPVLSQPLLFDTGAGIHVFPMSCFKSNTKFEVIPEIVSKTPDDSSPLILNKALNKLGLLYEVYVSEKANGIIISPLRMLLMQRRIHELKFLEDVKSLNDGTFSKAPKIQPKFSPFHGAFLFTRTCVYYIGTDDIDMVKKHKIATFKNGLWEIDKKYFGLSGSESNNIPIMSDVWAKSKYDYILAVQKKPNQIVREDGKMLWRQKGKRGKYVIVSDGIMTNIRL